MSLKTRFKIFNTLAFRLTIWYASIFALTFFFAILSFYIYAAYTLNETVDKNIFDDEKEFSFILSLKGIEDYETAIILESDTDEDDKVFYRLVSDQDYIKDGSSNLASWRFIPDEAALERYKNGSNHSLDTLLKAEPPGGASILYGIINKENSIVHLNKANNPKEERITSLKRLKRIIVIPMLIMIVFAGIIGWFMSKRALKGVEDITHTATNISNGEFNSRVSLKGRGDEIDCLAVAFNNMLEHIQRLIEEMKVMSDNIAHDLKSPVARIRGIAESFFFQAISGRGCELLFGSIIEECDRLLNMINTMLDISEAEAGVSKMDIDEINLSALIIDACELFQRIASDRNIALIHDFETDMFIHADRQKLQRVIANLLDNSLKYTGEGGTITISAAKNKHEASICFADNGIGISEEDLPQIFKRFYRCDRSRSKDGLGLGLNLALAIIQAHGGRITATSVLSKGSIFTVTIPQ